MGLMTVYQNHGIDFTGIGERRRAWWGLSQRVGSLVCLFGGLLSLGRVVHGLGLLARAGAQGVQKTVGRG